MIVDSNFRITEKELKDIFKVTVEEVKDSLTLPNPEYTNIRRFGKGFYSKVPKHLCYLTKEGDQYLLPRYYFGNKFLYDNPAFLKVNSGRKTTFKLKDSLKLRDYQSKFMDTNIKAINQSTGVLYEMPCGHGKTFCAIYLTAEIRKTQTLVVVPTYYLARQWKAAIEEVSDATTYIIQSTDTDIPMDKDFTIIVTDLFTVRDLPDKFVQNVGHVILDEAHRMGAETYLPILNSVPAKYRTALTATFRRVDGVHKILKYHFGEHLKMENEFPKPEVYAVRTGVKVRGVVSKSSYKTDVLINYMEERNIPFRETKGTVDFFWDFEELLQKDVDEKKILKKDYAEIRRAIKAAEKLHYSSVDSYLNQHSGRRKQVIILIQEALKKGRTVLFLSKRKDTLRALHKYFKEQKPMLIISETNNRTPEQDAYLQNECKLILGVVQLAKEGLDIERLDTLIIHLPIKDTEQAIGRIARLHLTKKSPKAIYMLDNHPMLYSTFTKAKKMFNVNGEYKGEVTLQEMKDIL